MQQQSLIMDELEIFLDARQAELLQALDRLNALRAAVIRRDEPVLSQLLEQALQDAEEHRRLDVAQAVLERRLTETIDGLEGPVTLSRLCDCLSGDRQTALRQKQQMLLELAQRVRNEHEATETLLRECARCNRLLLGAILGRSEQCLTYDPQGHSQWDVHRGLVSMKL
jgi:hypothetical protein